MEKKRLIKRFTEYYKLEGFHASWIACLGIYLNVKYGWHESLLLSYGILLVVFILAQGTYYWKIKLDKIKGHYISTRVLLKHFNAFRTVNSLLIALYPLLLVALHFYFKEGVNLQRNKGWAVFAYGFGVAEHINYYYMQLMYDNRNDWRYLRMYRRLKVASLRKDLNAATVLLIRGT